MSATASAPHRTQTRPIFGINMAHRVQAPAGASRPRARSARPQLSVVGARAPRAPQRRPCMLRRRGRRPARPAPHGAPPWRPAMAAVAALGVGLAVGQPAGDVQIGGQRRAARAPAPPQPLRRGSAFSVGAGRLLATRTPRALRTLSVRSSHRSDPARLTCRFCRSPSPQHYDI